MTTEVDIITQQLETHFSQNGSKMDPYVKIAIQSAYKCGFERGFEDGKMENNQPDPEIYVKRQKPSTRWGDSITGVPS